VPKRFIYVNETYYLTEEVLQFTDALLDLVIKPERKKKLFPRLFEKYAEETEAPPDVAGEDIPFDQQPFKRIKPKRLKFVISQFEELLSDTGCTPDAILRAAYNALFPPPFSGMLAKTNQYIAPYAASTGSWPDTAGYIRFVPIIIPYPVWIREMGVYVTTAAPDEEARIGIYPIERGLIGTKIADNCVSLGAINWNGEEFNVHLPPSAYMFAIIFSTGSAQIRRANVLDPILGFDKEKTVNPAFYTLQQTYDGTLPDTVDNDSLILSHSTGAPRVIARVEV